MHKAGSRHTDIRHESTSMHTPGQEGLQMIEATSCGGVVIFRGKLLVLYKNYRNKSEKGKFVGESEILLITRTKRLLQNH